jgi:hypothetical protein
MGGCPADHAEPGDLRIVKPAIGAALQPLRFGGRSMLSTGHAFKRRDLE